MPYVLPLILSAIIAFALGVYARQYRARAAAWPYAGLMFTSFFWSAAVALELTSVGFPAHLFWANFAFSCASLIPVAWLALALTYTGYGHHLRQFVPAALIIPTITNLWLWSEYLYNLPSGVPENITGYHLWLSWMFIPATILTVGISIFLLIQALFKVAPTRRIQTLVLLMSLLLPVAVEVLYLLGVVPLPDFNLTPVLVSLSGLVIGWDLFRYRTTDLTPVARDKVVESMVDSVIVLDPQLRLVDMNPAAQKLVNRPFAEAARLPLTELLPATAGMIEQLQNAPETHAQITLLGKSGANRCYDLHLTPLYDRRERLTGRLLVLHDITAYLQLEKQQQQTAQQNARLFQEEQHQRKVTESLRQTMLVLSSRLDHSAIVTEILRQAQQLVQYDSAAFFMEDGPDLRLTHGLGFDYAVIDSRIPLHSRNRTVQAFRQRRTFVIPDVRDDPHWYPFSDREQVHSCIATPLIIEEEAIGVLTVDRVEPRSFTDEDAQILQVFANQAAVAFRNAQLHQQAQAAAALEERNRLAQDLHDAINQTLFSAAIMAEALPEIWCEDPQRGAEVLEEMRLLTQGALAEMRTLLLELRPAALIEKNFGELLQHQVKAFTNRTRIPVELLVEGDCILPPDVQMAFYRITQETLMNITKHARADHVSVKFDGVPEEAALSISDNGRGFNINAILPGHFGVSIIHERAEKVGAILKIDSQPGVGTRVALVWEQGT